MQQNTETNNFRNKLTCAIDHFFSMDSRRENDGNNTTKNYRIFPLTIIFLLMMLCVVIFIAPLHWALNKQVSELDGVKEQFDEGLTSLNCSLTYLWLLLNSE